MLDQHDCVKIMRMNLMAPELDYPYHTRTGDVFACTVQQ